jgi:hypothetical protein
MTIDERLAFLVQSTESLHSTAQEFHASLATMKETVGTMKDAVDAHTAQLKIDAENIRRLATIAAAHEQRLDDLAK